MATPVTLRATREVINQPPALPEMNLFEADLALKEALEREGGAERASKLGQIAGSRQARKHAQRAERNAPACILTTPAGGASTRSTVISPGIWLPATGVQHEIASLSWQHERPGAHAVRQAVRHLGIRHAPAYPVRASRSGPRPAGWWPVPSPGRASLLHGRASGE